MTNEEYVRIILKEHFMAQYQSHIGLNQSHIVLERFNSHVKPKRRWIESRRRRFAAFPLPHQAIHLDLQRRVDRRSFPAPSAELGEA
jgi:hypothetical protein